MDGDNIFLVTIGKKDMFVKLYQQLVIDDTSYTFMGRFDNASDVPNINCVYSDASMGDKIRMKRRLQDLPTNEMLGKRESGEIKSLDLSDGGGEPLRIEINDDDDELMVLMKETLKAGDITVDDFKNLYGYERRNDMNNDKSRLEKKDSLSWKKFSALLKLLDLQYDITIYYPDNWRFGKGRKKEITLEGNNGSRQ
jgi:hypothetical protein